ncbi:MAG TPA: flagellar hook-basal body complex protein FliE, partial [Burkholderiaceae bacterium]|nr:flagellar hook-basal body complex protein FliE [Burkholderiaceae bacterium]
MNSIERIDNYLPPMRPTDDLVPSDLAPASAPPLQGTSAFGQWFTNQVEKVNTQIEQSERQLQAVATGEAQNLHQVMIDLEEARLSFQMLVQVRNRVLEAYQDVMRKI